MALRLVTPPVESPVSLTEAKGFLRVDHDDDDTLIQATIDAVAAWLSAPPHGWLNRSLCEQTIELALPCWPECRVLPLPFGPVSAISSVTYRDRDNADQTLSTDDYFLDGDTDSLTFIETFAPPLLYSRPSAVLVRYVAGEAAADLDQGLLTAIKFAITAWHENRGDMTTVAMQQDPKIRQVLSAYRLWPA